MDESITASWEYTKFDGDNEFRVAIFVTSERTRITCIGTGLPQRKGVQYKLIGNYETNKFGKQFKVIGFEPVAPKDEDSTVNYLASGILRGVGKKTAQRIYDMFGPDALNVIENEPQRLLDIRGITNEKLSLIIEDYDKAKGMNDLYKLFSKHKIPI